MQLIPITTPVLQPPQDDLFVAFDTSLSEVKERDIVVVSSKVVAIHEGACVPKATHNKTSLVDSESELTIARNYWSTPLTVKHHAFIGSAGIDESNGGGYYVLLPKDPFTSAKAIYDYLRTRFSVREIGVVITDSHSTPMRRGAIGISIGYWGFRPIRSYVGEPDLFGREMEVEVANVVDGIAAGATVVMGEAAECLPIVIVRDVPKVSYTNEPLKHQHMMSFKDDSFRVLYERFLK